MRHHHRLGILAMILAPVTGLLAGVGMSPALRIEHISISAPDASLAEEVRRSLQVPAEASVLFYPLNRISDQVKSCCRVSRVEIERRPPHELQVRVEARTPFVALNDGDGYTIVSRDGVCLYRQAVPGPGLPQLTGLVAPRPALGSAIPSERMQWTVDLLTGAAKAGLPRGVCYDLRSLHQITFAGPNGLQGRLGNVNNLARKMTIVGRIAQQLRQQGRRPGAIDVSTPEAPIWTVRS